MVVHQSILTFVCAVYASCFKEHLRRNTGTVTGWSDQHIRTKPGHTTLCGLVLDESDEWRKNPQKEIPQKYIDLYIYIALLDLRSILVGGLSIVSIAAKNGLSGLALKQS